MEAIDNQKSQLIAEAYNQYGLQVLATFRHAGIPMQDCEDMTQDVFIKLMELSIIREDTLKGLIFTIANCSRIDYFRHHHFMASHTVDDANALYSVSSKDTERMTEQVIRETEMKVVKKMSPTDCKVYTLARFEEKKAKEIALTLDLSTRSVEARIYRARIQVRQAVKQVIGL